MSICTVILRFFRWPSNEGGCLSGGLVPMNIYDDEQWKNQKPKPLRYKSAPKQRPLHKTRFR
jgi:hypothetical protein